VYFTGQTESDKQYITIKPSVDHHRGLFILVRRKGETIMSYKAEVLTIGDDNYYGNRLRFKEKKDAEAYALDLSLRWLAVKDYRVVESKDAPNR
jgi:hypothetical protein